MLSFCLGGTSAEHFTCLKTVTQRRTVQFSMSKESRTTDERFRVATSKSSESYRHCNKLSGAGRRTEGIKEGCRGCGSVTSTGLPEHLEPVGNDRQSSFSTRQDNEGGVIWHVCF